MNNKPFLSIVIPCYNEELRLKSTLSEIKGFLAKQDYPSEIILVDDGSADKTLAVAKALSKKTSFIKIIKNNKNTGKGYAVKRGMLKAKGRFRLFMDADNSTSVSEFQKLIPYLNDYDLVIGSRKTSNSLITRKQHALKRLTGSLGNAFIRLFVIKDFKDTQCGFKCFSEKTAIKLFPLLETKRWGFDVELLALAKLFKCKIKEVGVRWSASDNSKVTFFSYIYTIWEILKIKWNIAKIKRKLNL